MRENDPSLLQTAIRQFEAGNASAALEAARELLSRDPDNIQLLDFAGHAALRVSQPAFAAGYFSQASMLDPRNSALLFNLGLALGVAGRGEDSEQAYRRALHLDPRFVAAWLNLANALYLRGQAAEARVLLKSAVAQGCDDAEIYYNLGKLCREGNAPRAALTWLERAKALRPARHILSELAEAHRALGQHDLAVAALRQAVAEAPGELSLSFHLAQMLASLSRIAEARAVLEAAELHAPDDPEIHSLQARFSEKLGDSAGVLDRYRRLAALGRPEGLRGIMGRTDGAAKEAARSQLRLHVANHPEDEQSWIALGGEAYARAAFDEGIEILEHGIARNPSAALRLTRALTLPKVPESRDQIDFARASMERHLDTLIAEGGAVADLQKSVNKTAFHLPYHGLNNRTLQMKVARAHAAVAPYLRYTAPHCRGPARRKKRLRIGFLSDNFLTHHTVGKYFRALIRDLDRARFEVVLCTPSGTPDGFGMDLRAAADTVISYPYKTVAAQPALGALELDVLVYPDIGMGANTYYLSFARLAPVQMVFGGHPMTTGVDTIDYFVSSVLKEAGDTRSHYSEQPILLPTLPYYYAAPHIPEVAEPRAALGLPEDATLYACPQTIYKFHPDFDAVLARIFARDPRAKLVVIALHGGWAEMLWTRMERTIPDIRARVIVLPRLEKAGFAAMLRAADVMLDPLHFSGGVTTYEACVAGTPVVTLPGEFMCGRWTTGIHRQCGMEHLIVETEDAYADLAVKIANDPAFRAEQSRMLSDRRQALFDSRQALADLERMFEEAFAARVSAGA